MQRVLIVKTSSLGDVVHALPALSDLKRHFPQISVDWLVEESFADIPALHFGIGRVIPCALRRWRRNPLSSNTRGEIKALRRLLREENYDLVLDLQGLLKTIWLVCSAGGRRHGYDASSIREALASCFYQVRHSVSWSLQAVDRNRLLAARALGYAISGAADYGLSPALLRSNEPERLICFHGTSRLDKLWPETKWRELLAPFSERGVQITLPSGTQQEAERGHRIAQNLHRVDIPLQPPLAVLARACANAFGVIGVDTGLTHLAAATGAPVIAIYCATDPALTGVIGAQAPAINLGGIGASPSVESVLMAAGQIFSR